MEKVKGFRGKLCAFGEEALIFWSFTIDKNSYQ